MTTPTTAASAKPVRIRISDCAEVQPVVLGAQPVARTPTTISVTVGSVSNRSHSRTWLAVSSCQSADAAATDADPDQPAPPAGADRPRPP